MSEAKQKGDLLEDIVASMYKEPGTKVETRVPVPVKNSPKKSTREIDVLITKTVLGLDLRFAISCKNEKSSLERPTVTEFIGTLGEIGIPPQNAIMVNVAGFTSGAKEAAKLAGIKCYTFKGLSPDRLNQEIGKAIQSTVFLFVNRTTISYFQVPMPKMGSWSPDIPVIKLENPEKPPQSVLMDIVWECWISGVIPAEIGCHFILVKPVNENLPWCFVLAPNVVGLVDAVDGTFRHGKLVDAHTGELAKIQFESEFQTKEGRVELTQFENEEDLKAAMSEAGLNIQSRNKVPRINSNIGFWPPTKEKWEALKREFEETGNIDHSKFSCADLNEAWEASEE